MLVKKTIQLLCVLLSLCNITMSKLQKFEPVWSAILHCNQKQRTWCQRRGSQEAINHGVLITQSYFSKIPAKDPSSLTHNFLSWFIMAVPFNGDSHFPMKLLNGQRLDLYYQPTNQPINQPTDQSLWGQVWGVNWSNSQIPQCTCPISHNAPFRTEICAFLFWMVYCGIWNRCIVGYMRLVYCWCKIWPAS